MDCEKECAAQGISVVIPVFNAQETLAKTIESVLAQTYPVFEILLVDDGSSDHSRDIMEAYSLQDSRIRVLLNEQNCGVAISRNRGVQQAKYDWICFLDSDDCWREDKLELQLQAILENPKTELCFTASSFVDQDGNESEYVLHVPKQVTFDKLLRQNVISCSSVMVRRQLLLDCPMPHDRAIHEDYATWLTILRRIPYALGVDIPLLTYRLSASSRSGNKKKAACMQWRTYRYMHLPLLRSGVCFAAYMVNGIRKHRTIRKEMH